MTDSPTQPSVPAGAWQTRGMAIPLDHPIVIGILNATPDSFSDGGRFNTTDSAVARVERMLAEGADVVDVGGESTRPHGATAIGVNEELARVVPIIRAIRFRFPAVALSVDTNKRDVALAALEEGANIINDVSAFRLDPRMREIAASTGAGVILMHSRGQVEDMATYKYADYGGDVVGDVLAELEPVVRAAIDGGIRRDSVVVDPGIGFAKRTRHSLQLVAGLRRLESLGYPIVVGMSRKRFIGELSKVKEASARVAGTVGANVAALMNGARLFRVHDVAPNRQALDVAWGVLYPDVASRNRAPNIATPPGSPFPVPRSRQT